MSKHNKITFFNIASDRVDFFLGSRLDKDGIIEKIEKYKRLPEGWDFGQGVGTLKSTAQKAIGLYNTIKQNLYHIAGIKWDVTPMSDGGLILLLCLGEDVLNLSINPNSTIDLTWEEGLGSKYVIM